MNLSLQIESLIFASDSPLKQKDILQSLKVIEVEIRETDLQEILEKLLKKYQNVDFPFQIVEIAEGYTFMTKEVYHDTIAGLVAQRNKKRLSRSALETLSIIAYKQPITKSEVEEIRGVNSDYAVGKLLERELIESKGRADKPGKPMLYGTTDVFMDHFGLKNLSDLPQLRDIPRDESDSEKAINA